MVQNRKQWFWWLILTIVFMSVSASAQAPYRVNHSYEDSVRIAIIWNDPIGNECGNASIHQPVGEKTKNIVLRALDTTIVRNVKVLRNQKSKKVTWTDIENLWGANRLPHTIVHVNAGWSVGWNEGDLQNTLQQAVSRKIGVVSVGDDAANLANVTFGFDSVVNSPSPLGDGTTIDSLWVGLIRANDNKLKVYEQNGTTLEYPGVNGVISNTVDRILNLKEIIQFLPRNNGRCQADADRYFCLHPEKLTMLGYQQGYLGSIAQPDRSHDLNVLVALQDTIDDPFRGPTIRRGVAVSFQPQFLANSIAAQQITYDAIMFASLAHTLSVPTTLIIKTEDDTLTAGDIDSLKAYIIDQKGDTITDPTITVKINWGFTQAHTGDRFVGNNYGATVRYTALEAYRMVHIYATYITKNGIITDTAAVYVRPGPAHHLVIESSSTPPLYGDNPIGGNSSITIGQSQTEARGFAILRDRYTNLVSFSTSTRWDTLPPTGLISARNGQINYGEGIISKLLKPGVTYLRAVNIPGNFSDTVTVTIENTTYDSLRIMQFDVGLGRLVRINSLSMRTSDTTTLYVQGLKTGSGVWVDVPGNWIISTGLKTNPNPPSAQKSWRFTPADTGHGTITVNLAGGLPNVTIPAVFSFGVPTKLEIYPIRGNPGTTRAFPQPPIIADTVTAGVIFSKLYAKLFDAKSTWLSEYETNYSLSQQIRWSVTPVDETTLSVPPIGYSTTLTSTRAYRIVRVKATLNNMTDSVFLYVKADIANHLVIEATAQIRDSINDDPLSRLTISADQTFGYVYAILRDRFGNFVNYSKATNWVSLDTTVFKADTGITSFGEGYAGRNCAQGNSKMVAINIDNNFKDTVPVEIQSIYYTALRVYLLDNGPKYIDTIRVHLGEQLPLYVEGMRSDNQKWELVPATWSMLGGLKTITPPPTTMTNQWTVAPDSVGSGWIKVTRGSAIPDSIRAFFILGLPNSIAIYKEAGNPYAQVPYLTQPQVNTVIAGTTVPLFAKIFDLAGNWLSSYENSSISQQLITWSITKTQGSAPAETLQSRNGNSTSFTPTKAYTSYAITAQFKDTNGLPITTQISFTVVPDTADHLVIEGTSNITGLGLNSDQPISRIEFGSKDTLKTAYAILRDRFGNLAQTPYSTSTQWSSLDTLIVKAQEGVPQVGEGKIFRIGVVSQTKVVAVNRQNPLLRDTVDVMIKDFSYDSLRIVVDVATRIESLTMRSDQDTTLRVQGLLSSGVWVTVESDWLYKTTSTSTNVTKSSVWNFAPGDTGTGIIIVSLGEAVPDTILVKILPGLPAKLALYGKEGPVPDFANPPYINPTDTIFDTAGRAFPLVAKIFDHRGVYLSEYELLSSKSNQIHWTVQEMAGFDGTGRIDDTIGHNTNFLPVKAYQSVYIISTFSSNQTTYRDTILLSIVPGDPKQLVIEGSPDWMSSPNKPNPIDTVQITDSTTSASVYAVLRDSLGNFINYANVSEWGVVDNDTIITVQKGNISLGEGAIERKQSTGIAKVYALDTRGFEDTTVIQLLAYHYLALRILCNITEIDSLSMNTNQDTTLRVQGFRSDTAVWEDVAAKWENSTNLKTQPPAPGKAHAWRFSPTDTGTGWIRVSMGNDMLTAPDSISVHFEIGPPVRATIEIVTPKELLIAGEPIKTVVTIYNEDGKVPYWCFYTKDIKFTDVIGRGGDIRPKPYVLLGNDTLFLSENFIDSASTHCFNNGVDTVVLRLFYVPNSSDSLHQITVNLGSIKASTPPFVLLPAKLNSITLEKDGIALTDTLSLTYQDENVIIFAIGYDKYGNRRGAETSNWTVDPTLPPISGANKVSRVIYDVTGTINNSTGTLKAISNENPSVYGNVVIKITAPLVTVKTATTRDNNGNGLIDGIDIVFSKSILLPEGFKFQEITIRYDNKDVNFVVDSVYSTNGQADTVWHLVIHEVVTTDPQTSWTPVISFKKTDSLQLESADNLQTKDGAGPVVWKVTKEIVSLEDRKQDIVTIVFSEPVVREIDGSKLSTADAPSKMFYIWELRDSTYVRVDSILVGINNIISYNGTTLKFYTSNGNNISSKNFMSLNDSIGYIKDVNGGTGNKPISGNVKVNVLIINSVPAVLQSVPNPASPTFARVKPGELKIEHEPNARSWVRTDHGGTVITFPIAIPDKSENVTLRCKVKIHDISGNIVIANEQSDILRTIPSSIRDGRASTYDIELYWNGSNFGGMKVAPGVYKIVVSLDYSGASSKKSKCDDTRFVGVLGIGR